MTKTTEKPYPFGAEKTFIAHISKYPPPPRVNRPQKGGGPVIQGMLR